MKFLAATIAATVAVSSATDKLPSPTVTLRNGVKMPLVALGVWQYDNATAKDAITKGLSIGYTHIDTAYDYNNQQGVGEALKDVPRDSFFLTTKTPPCKEKVAADCYNATMAQLEYDLEALQMDHVDLVLIHGTSGNPMSSCDQDACDKDYEQWRAYEDFYHAGKAKAIGVSNFCVSCMECLYSKPLTVSPAVNQFQLHVGMGSDATTQELIAENLKRDTLPQAYSPLGNGKLISDKDLEEIGKHYNKTSAQVALKWIVSQGLPVATKADSVEYLTEDLDLFSWNFTEADMTALTKKDTPVDRPSWSCTK